jgi:integrase
MNNISILAQLKIRAPFATIIIRGYFNRKPVASKSTGYKILHYHWNTILRRVAPSAPNAALINSNLHRQLQQMEASLLQKELMGVTLNSRHVKEAILGHRQHIDFIQYCKQRIKQDYTNAGTQAKMESHCSKLESFRKPVLFADIDVKFLRDYKTHMEEKLKNKKNTIWGTFKFVNTMINKAMKEGGIIQANPFKEFDRGVYTDTIKPHLQVEHCNRIHELIENENTNLTLKKVAIKFMLMVYSGMRFSDAMRFNPDVHTENGRFVMQYNKFSEQVNYKMHDRLQQIIERTKEFPLQMSLNSFNDFLKVIAVATNIPINLTSHVGRHTMGFLLSEMDVPEEKARLILGHKDRRSTRTYYHVTDDQVDLQVQKLNGLNKKSPVETGDATKTNCYMRNSL